MQDSYDVVIAGAGIAGLTLAALLADVDDCSVLLVEKNEAAGGRFHVEHRAGYLVDWGVHACLLGSRGAIGSVLSRCENPPSIVPAGAAIYRDGKILPFLGKSLATLARQRVFSKGDLLRLGVDALRVRGADWERTSLSEWAAGRRASPSLDGAMRALCTGLLPTDQFERASSGELFAFLRRAMRSMVALGYPVGGWGAVLDALVSAVERSTKCRLVLGAELERIIAPAGRVERVVVGGRELRARAVVCAFPPQQLAGGGFVEPGLPPEYARTLASLEEGTGIFIDIGLESPVTSDDRLIMALEPPALLWAVSNVSQEVAPPDRQLLQLFSPIKNRDRDDDDFKLQRTGELIDLAERVFGGALREEWRRVVVSTIVGVVPFTNQGMHSRPDIPVPGFDGIFIIGDGVRAPGLGGDLAARSAIIAEPLVRSCLERKRE